MFQKQPDGIERKWCLWGGRIGEQLMAQTHWRQICECENIWGYLVWMILLGKKMLSEERDNLNKSKKGEK